MWRAWWVCLCFNVPCSPLQEWSICLLKPSVIFCHTGGIMAVTNNTQALVTPNIPRLALGPVFVSLHVSFTVDDIILWQMSWLFQTTCRAHDYHIMKLWLANEWYNSSFINWCNFYILAWESIVMHCTRRCLKSVTKIITRWRYLSMKVVMAHSQHHWINYVVTSHC